MVTAPGAVLLPWSRQVGAAGLKMGVEQNDLHVMLNMGLHFGGP